MIIGSNKTKFSTWKGGNAFSHPRHPSPSPRILQRYPRKIKMSLSKMKRQNKTKKKSAMYRTKKAYIQKKK
jgi:hypothetical protein